MVGIGGRNTEHHGLDDDALDQIEGEALIVVENPDRYSPVTVEMARRTLAMIQRLRRRGSGGGALEFQMA